MTAVVADRIGRRRRSRRRAGVIAVIAVPLAFAGLALAAFGDPAQGIERIPVALVNDDDMVTQVDEATGEESFVLAGRQLVTELTGGDSPVGLDWQLTNATEAAAKLAVGEVYAALIIPDDFSDAILSIQGDEPRQARIEIRTDDAHSYAAGPVAEALGSSMVRAFGTAITETFIVNVFDQVGSAFSDAADGAEQLADGAEQAAGGAAQFADGVGQYADGVSQLSGGVRQYTGGVSELASGMRDYAGAVAVLADGLLDPQQGVPALATGIQGYAGGVSQLSAAIAQVTQALQADPGDAELLGQLAELSAQLSAAAESGPALAGGVSQLAAELQGPEGLPALVAGADGLASGAKQLASGGRDLASGAAELAAGGSPLASGAGELADGVSELADGAGQFAGGLREGADGFSDQEATERLADVVSDPVGYAVQTEHSVAGSNAAMATALLPFAAWVGALVLFLVLPPFPTRSLASSASIGRLLLGALVRAGGIAALQALLLVGLLHLVAGVSWALLPATLGFSLIVAAAFTAFHAALWAAFGRAGLVGSFLVLALQLAASGVILPVEALAPGAAWISPYLPLSWATTGLQQVITSGSAGLTAGSVIGLALFGAACVVVAAAVLRRTRRNAVLGMLAPA